MNLSYLVAKLVKKLHGRALTQTWVHPTSKVEAGSEVVHSRIDRHSFCGYHCEIIHCDIGSFCSIANHVVIGGGMHPIDWVSTSPAFYRGRDSIAMKYSEHDRPPVRRTIIGHDVWIGERAIIKQGVSVGTGAVIGMGSVVTRDVDPYAIVGGVPARMIRGRFPPPLAQRLLESAWWTLDDQTLRRASVYATDPEAFLREIAP
jgi:acetyltransferase-like isoleucine patch superfamily enzyme